jgi:hypothetical protein
MFLQRHDGVPQKVSIVTFSEKTSMETTETERKAEREFTVIVIATSSKNVEAKPHERVATLKREAMRKFNIPQDKAEQYRLASTAGDPTSEFDDSKTAADYGLHEGSEIYLVKAHNDA